jgi:hypothetical protein
MWESSIYKLNQPAGTDEDGHWIYKQIVIDVTRSAPSFATPGKALSSALEVTLEAAGIGPADTILDFGAGKLRNTLYLLERGYRVCAVEFADQFTHSKPARENLARARSEFAGRFSTLLYPADFIASDRRFKLVLLINVINIMPVSPERLLVLQACHGKLADGGFLLWYTQRGDAHYEERLKQQYRIGDGVYVGRHAKYKTFYREYTVDEIDALLAQAGFTYDRKVEATWRNQSRLYRKTGDTPLVGLLSPELIDLAQVIDDRIPDPTTVEPKTVSRKGERKKGDPNPDQLTADQLWIEALAAEKEGYERAASYEDLVRRLLEHLFAEELRNLQFVPPSQGFRDIMAENRNRLGFFSSLKAVHNIRTARILVKCRNARLSVKDFDGIVSGMDRLEFGLLAYRGGMRKSAIGQCQKLFLRNEKVILPLDDKDFRDLLRLKMKAGQPGSDGGNEIDSFLTRRLREIMVPVRVFLSYSRKDRRLMEELEAHLTPLDRRGAIKLWIDRSKVQAGDLWQAEIRREVASAEVAILLVSPYSLASSFIDDNEVDPLLDAQSTRGIRIIPVLLHSADLPAKLDVLQFANDKQPVGDKEPAARHKIWTAMVERVKSLRG